MDSKFSPLLLQPYDTPFCPSFSSYSSNIADVAARVTTTTEYHPNHPKDDVEDEFEFVLVNEDQTETVFPVFNRNLLLDDVANTVMLPLKQLFLEDQPSSSASESDELDSVPPGTYCVWTPRTAPSPSPSPSPGRCKKSNSTGSSAAAAKKPMWRLRDLLRRSSSDGKHSLVFLNKPGSFSNEKKVEKAKTVPSGKETVSAHEAFYVRNKALKEGGKRRSYLPYRQDLVGFFANANFGRTFSPF